MAKKIVIVDDDPFICELLETVLAKDYEVHLAHDGNSGLSLIRDVTPDLAILDVRMPGMHGYELCQALRKEEGLQKLKILFVSAKSYMADINTAKEIGAADYLVKPFDTKDLRKKVSELIGV